MPVRSEWAEENFCPEFLTKVSRVALDMQKKYRQKGDTNELKGYIGLEYDHGSGIDLSETDQRQVSQI